MLSLTAIHDSDVLRDHYALIALVAYRNSHSPDKPNASYPQIIGYSRLCEHPPGVTDSSRRIQSP